MRKLRLVVTRSRGALPLLVLAALVPDVACGARDSLKVGAERGAGGNPEGGVGGDGGVITTFVGGSGGVPNNGPCGPAELHEEFVVTVPDPGTPATPGAICAVMTEPVGSNEAARVTLSKYSMDLHLAKGFIELAPPLQNQVVGLPLVEVVSAQYPDLMAMQVTNVQANSGGFSFDAEWPAPLLVEPDIWAEMVVRTTMEVACDAIDNRTFQSITYVHLCQEEDDVAWVSSGDTCNTCSIIAEMAPSPIVPDKMRDDLPLARALRLRVVVLARIGRALVLLAENDGGGGLHYEWEPSAGEVTAIAPDVILWRVPEAPGPHLVQAAVIGDDGAAVASFTWEDAA